jgi:post-segregation antitoxin (ccd killing protein)
VRSRRSFTLRFANPRTYDVLSAVAKELGLSMSELAERMIETELDVLAAGLEGDVARTVEKLRQTDMNPEAEAAEFARAEVENEDPIQARMARPDDPFGVAAAFDSGSRR